MESKLSFPDIIDINNSMVLIQEEMGPIWSKEEAYAIKPCLETIPYVGLKPIVLQKAAGCLTEPPVSLPIAK